MDNKGFSLITLIVTIIIIILLSAIGGFYTHDTLDKAERMDVEEEMRNIEELVSIQKAKILAGQYEIPETYIATDSEIDEKYGELLGTDDIEEIKKVNNDSNISPNKKYHLMDGEAFEAVFNDGVSVRYVKREYLVNFEKKVIILNQGDKLYMVGKIRDDA